MHINQLFALGTGLLSASILVTAQQQSGDTNGGGGTQSGNGTSSDNGPQVQLTSANDFCLFLPPEPGLEVAVNEDNGIPYCMNPATIQGSHAFPEGFITTAHYQQTDSYTQITGFFDRTKYNLSPDDGGGQYDSHAKHKPVGASCQNFPYFVSMIEPSNDRFCIRCCQNTEDCKTGISQNGCQRVVTPGNYDNNNAFDSVPPSPDNDGSADASGSSSASPSASGSDSPSASASGAAASSGNGNDNTSSAGTGGGDDGTSPGIDNDETAAAGDTTGEDNHSDQDDSQDLPNTSYNSVLDDLDTVSSSQHGDTSGADVSSSSADGNDVKTVEDEAKFIQSQLENPQVDFNALKTQFSNFASNLSKQFPKVADKIKQLKDITSQYETADQWQRLAAALQQKSPGASTSSAPASDAPASGTPSEN